MSADDWRHRARCRDVEPELFFPVGTGGPAEAQEKAAKAICALCPVRAECLTFALTAPWPVQGVWGGEVFGKRELRQQVEVAV